MPSFHRQLVPLFIAAVVLCGCGAPQPPQCRHVPWSSRVPAASLLAEAGHDWAVLGDGSRRAQWPAARTQYNAAVAKLFDQLRCGSARGWDQRAAALGTRLAPPGRFDCDPGTLDAVFPAAAVNVHSVNRHITTEGVGLPVVGWKKTTPVGVKRGPYLLPNGYPYVLTATLEFGRSGPPVWHFVKRWLREDLTVSGTAHPLAADWTAPNAFFWQMCELDNLSLVNVILPDRYTEETGLYFVEDYDPKRIPLVFVHGLVSSPDAFKNMINELAPEPWFRQHYQIWLYNYPTGNPWIFSSMKFRESMRGACAYARTKGDDRNLKRMVIVGHSMGGLLTRSSVTDPKNVLYDADFNKPLGTLKVSEKTRKLIRDTYLYQPLKEPQRVVFIAVPHRGSPVADFRISLWISRLIHLPKTLTVDLLDATVHAVGDAMKGGDPAAQLPTSINSLSPNNNLTVALNKLPLPGRITFHSIIGDRGKGDTPNSSDGVVPYRSSHITPVASELIVPSYHSAQNDPLAAAELKRILKLHLGERSEIGGRRSEVGGRRMNDD